MVVHQMAIHRIFILFFSLLIVVTATPVAAKVTATIDRTSIVADETLTLTISKDGSSFFTDPDLKPLHNDFNVLGQNQQSSTQIINGSASSSVVWKITLAPRRTGKLEIPQLAVGKEKTNSLKVQVSAEAQAKTSADDAPVFIETDVSEHSVFVQSQVIFTLRIYWAINVQIVDPGEPNAADALIEKLDDTTFEKIIDGTPYRVFERKYALFPQKSGVLNIPQMTIQVNVLSGRSRRNFFDPLGTGETVKLRSEAEEVEVREKPQEYPAGAVWLPSAGLTITEKWSQDSQNLKVGESATLSLKVTADGLMGEQLPPLELEEPDGLKLYQGKAEVANLNISTGIIGTRKESIALIPTHSGEVELPEIRIPWWDIDNQKVEYAVIPARTLVIQGTGKQPETQPPAPAQDTGTQIVPVTPAVEPPAAQERPILWVVLCLVFAAAWLITLVLLLKTRRQMKVGPGGAINADKEQSMKERKAFKSFVAACEANEPGLARASVMTWARAFWPKENIQIYADIERVVFDPGLTSLLNEIDSALYSHGQSPGSWQGAPLLEQVKKVRSDKGITRKKEEQQGGLQKLYK